MRDFTRGLSAHIQCPWIYNARKTLVLDKVLEPALFLAYSKLQKFKGV